MNTIEQDILNWTVGRPDWQRNLLKRIALGESIDDDYIIAIAKSLQNASVALEVPVLEAKDLPTGAAGGTTTSLLGVGALQNVNALLEGQTLTFGAIGVTIVYGDNGSGKSGYARLLKSAVGARHREEILPDAFSPSTGAQSATISFAVDGEATASDWPDIDEAALGQVHFYDEACGDDYLQRESELTYRPSVLTLLDRLVVQVDRVRGAVDALIADNEARRFVPPVVPMASPSEAFILQLSAKTTRGEVDAATTLADGAAEEQARLVTEEGRLKGTNPVAERARLLAGASKVALLADHLDKVETLLSPTSAAILLAIQNNAQQLRTAADNFSSTSFADEIIDGVGSETWRALWAAAERFSQHEAFPDRDFPATDPGDACVLCHQPLDDGARDRLRRFHVFVHNDVARQAAEAEERFRAGLTELSKLDVKSADTEAAITFLSVGDEALAASLTGVLDSAVRAKALIGKRLRGESDDSWEDLDAADSAGLRVLAQETTTRANAIDHRAFEAVLSEVMTKRKELEGRIALSKAREEIITETERLSNLETLRTMRAGITTQAVTKVSADLARRYVTDVVKDHFVRESERLKLEHVILGDKGGAKGKIRHQPALLGASGSSPMQVLSEGEQTAAGLAGFFTEVEFDQTKSTVVFDDPMSSLDHQRRDRAARRVVEIAQDRQVVVFTHDLMFLGEIVKVAGELDVPLAERAIQRNGARRPGFVIEGHPWKAKDAKTRLHSLQVTLDRIKKDQAEMSSDEFERESADWAGKLSETWERIARTEVAYKLVDRGTTEVRPRMFKVIAQITSADDTEFQAGYGVTSKWARRHDKSEEVNHTPPMVEDMQVELDRAKAWFARVKSYENG